MTSKLKCPFCETELEQMHDKKLLGCPKCLRIADGAFWAKATQAKQDLEIARQALEKLICEYNRCRDEEFEGEDRKTNNREKERNKRTQQTNTRVATR